MGLLTFTLNVTLDGCYDEQIPTERVVIGLRSL
jgi:hypothetical protein